MVDSGLFGNYALLELPEEGTTASDRQTCVGEFETFLAQRRYIARVQGHVGHALFRGRPEGEGSRIHILAYTPRSVAVPAVVGTVSAGTRF